MASEPSTTPQDPRLLARMAAGDESALAELYDRHAGPVYSLVSAIVRNAADAEEVTTDVFVQAWSTAGHFDPKRGSADGWLLTLARSRALDRVRSRKRRAARLERSAVREGEERPFPSRTPGRIGSVAQSRWSCEAGSVTPWTGFPTRSVRRWSWPISGDCHNGKSPIGCRRPWEP